MSKFCDVCGKGPTVGTTVARRGLPKKKGGIGLKTTGVSKRRFLPNLQSVKAKIEGTVKRIRICTSCMKAGKVQKVA